MFPIAQSYVREVVLVSDDEIVEAQKSLWETVRVAAEPGGAAAFAALLSGRYKTKPGERVGVIVCGGNTDKVLLYE
jgi:threonine dehydratase